MTKAIPTPVAAAFAAFPADVRERLLLVRAMIFRIAAETDGVGPISETLKWGEPAYLTAVSRSGSTIRLGWPKAHPDHAALFVNCSTSLVGDFRAMFEGELAFSGNRAVLLPLDGPLPEVPLAQCIALALTYKKARKSKR